MSVKIILYRRGERERGRKWDRLELRVHSSSSSIFKFKRLLCGAFDAASARTPAKALEPTFTRAESFARHFDRRAVHAIVVVQSAQRAVRAVIGAAQEGRFGDRAGSAFSATQTRHNRG